jgi:hypothetical protein
MLSNRPRGSVINKQRANLHTAIIFRNPSVWACKNGQKSGTTGMVVECIYCSRIPKLASKLKVKLVIKLWENLQVKCTEMMCNE